MALHFVKTLFLIGATLVLSSCGAGSEDEANHPDVSANVEAGQADVAVGTIFTVTFGAAIDVQTVTDQSFFVVADTTSSSLINLKAATLSSQCTPDNALPGTIGCAGEGLSCTLTLDNPLEFESAYILCLTGKIRFANSHDVFEGISYSFVTQSNPEAAENTFTVGGTLSGLNGTVVLQNNGWDDLTVNANGDFTFATPLVDGAGYVVTVKTNPSSPHQTCTVSNGSGTVSGSNVTGVTVGCTNNLCTTCTVFVTSATSTGNLGGLDGADETCNMLACNAGLSGTYAAWLSTGDVDAKDRIVDAEYVLVNGTVVANDLADLIDASLDNTIRRDENGVERFGFEVWTGAESDGTAHAGTCNDWTSGDNAHNGRIGNTNSGNSGWTSLGNTACGVGQRLYCFQVEEDASAACSTYTVGGTISGLSGTIVLQNNGGDDLSLTADGSFTFATTVADGFDYAVTVLTQPAGQTCTVSTGNGTVSGANVAGVTVSCVTPCATCTVFATSATSMGNLGGLQGADDVCNTLAGSAGLGGTFVAWLSTGDTDAKDRIVDAEYRLVDGITVVANDLADLLDASLDNAILTDESGNNVAFNEIWTGTNTNGTANADTCSDWTADAGNGHIGNNGNADAQWTSQNSPVCGVAKRFYCFQVNE